jgi:hypothetical protein
VTKAESQAMLNTPTDHHFQDAFKKVLGMVYTREEDYFGGHGGW